MRSVIIVVTLATIAGVFVLGRRSVDPPQGQAGLRTLASLERALHEPDLLDSNYLFSAYMQGLDADRLPETLQLIEASGRRLTNFEIEMLMLAWARFDPEEAFKQALFNANVDGRRSVGAATYAWATHDPTAAQSAMYALRGDPLEELLFGRLVAGWVRGGGLSAATQFVRESQAGPGRQFLTGAIANELAERSPAEVIAWADSVDAGDGFKLLVFQKATATLARLAPAQGAGWLGRHIDAPYADGCLWVLAWNWVESEPVATFEWLAALPPGTKRAEAVRKAFAYWLKTDSESAEGWLRNAPPSATLDPALRIVVMNKLEESPGKAINWARRISDKGRRERLMVQVGQSWMQEDPEAAKRWVAASGLPATARRAILNRRS
jgi:hypothetical protein